MISNEYRIFCGPLRGHDDARRWLGPVTVVDLEDNEGTFQVEIDKDAESEKFKVVGPYGAVYMKCPTCGLDVREEQLNLGRALTRISDTLGQFDVDLAMIPAAMRLHF